MCGNVFGREQSGAYAVQLHGFPGVIRVCPSFSDKPVRNFSMCTPVPVITRITKYDNTSQLFHGSVVQCSSTISPEPDTFTVSGVDSSVRLITRRLRPMVVPTY
jgi:hypothetical protein